MAKKLRGVAVRAALGAALGVAASVALATGAAALSAGWLTASEIEQTLKGHTLEGMYVSGRRFTERYLESGAVEYIETGVITRGHWSVTEGTLCTIYDNDPTGGCFRVAASGKNCLEFYFVARSEEAAPCPPGVKPSWTARGAVDGEAEACKDGANV